jgi:hypothetical protein
MRTINLDTTSAHITWLLMLQYGGLGVGMMPLFSAGLAVIPAAFTNTASAFNNVVQRTAAALGVAVFTAILVLQQAQLMGGRLALLPVNTPTPSLGPPGTPDWLGLYATYHRTELQVFVAAISNMFLIMAGLCALGALGALLLRSGPAPATPASVTPPAQASSTPPSANGDRHLSAPPAPIATTNGRPA